MLYRSADAIDRTGAAREAADSLYAELFGLTERDGERRSLLRYFHGRSSLATWLRAVLAQRYVDHLRRARRTEPLPDDADPARADLKVGPYTQTRSVGADLKVGPYTEPDRRRFVATLRLAISSAIGRLAMSNGTLEAPMRREISTHSSASPEGEKISTVPSSSRGGVASAETQ